MVEINPSQIVAINLKFGSQARPLKTLAFADLAANGLFLLNRDATIKEVAKEVARLLGIPGIDEKLIGDALNALRLDKKTRAISGAWRLEKEANDAIAAERAKSDEALTEVLKKHFPGSIEMSLLREWFLKASSDFFGFNGAEWVKSISKTGTVRFAKPQTIRDLLKASIRTYKLTADEDALVDAYDAFLSSDDPADLQYVMNLGFAMFSAQLVAADVGADPITIDEIRDATFILDTNTLFAMQLDAHHLASSIRALSLALSDIGAELIFLPTTGQEYRRVCVGKKGEILSLFRDFPPEVVLDAKNDFIETGVSRGYKTVEDFEGFLEDLRTIPSELPSGIRITERDDPKIEGERTKAEEDATLKKEIQKHCLRLRGKWDVRPKSESALKHDAVLIRVAEQLKKEKKKTWVLSLDRGLRACAAERAGAHGMPVVFMLDGLIQILAVQSGGPNRNAADFAPLLTSIILNRCSPSERIYTLQDLIWLRGMQQRVADFTPEDIKKVVGIVAQYRLAGAMADDSKLQLAVNRAFQEKKMEYNQEVEQANDRARRAEIQAESANRELETTKKSLERLERVECVRAQWRKLWHTLCWRIPVSIVAVVCVYEIATWSFPTTQNDWLGWVSSLLTFAAVFGWLLVQPIKTFLVGRAACEVEPLEDSE